MVVLYHPSGEALAMEAERWRAALRAAEDAGWRPSGTRPPPRRLGSEKTQGWAGGYAEPQGQEVVRDDARALSEALARSGHGESEPLRRFAARAGFIVCAAHSLTLELLALSRSCGETQDRAEPATAAPAGH